MIVITSEDTDIFEKNIFLGYAYDDNNFVIGTKGFNKYMSEKKDPLLLSEGRFFCKFVESDKLKIFTDSMNSEIIYIFNDDNFWAISNSIYLLSKVVRNKGYKLTINKNVVASFFIPTSLYEQPISDQQVFKEIEVLDGNSYLQIDEKNKLSYIKKTKSSLEKIMESKTFFGKCSYFISFYSQLIKQLAQKNKLNLELSGGVDSRINLAFVLNLIRNNQVHILTDRNKKDDYAVVKNLTEKLNIDINPFEETINNDSNIKFNLYKIANMFISRTVKYPNSKSSIKPLTIVRLNGGGGEMSRPFYNTNLKAYLNLIDKQILKKEYKEILKKELNNIMFELGYENSPEKAVIKHYTLYRNKYFVGRSWYYSLNGITFSPMSSSLYFNLANSIDVSTSFGLDSSTITNKNMIQNFLMKQLNIELLNFNFDKDEKNINAKFILQSDMNITLEGIYDVKEFNFYGQFDQSVDDIDFLKLAKYFENYNFSGYDDMIYKDIKEFINEDSLKNLDIFEPIKITELVFNIENKNLSKYELLGLFHLSNVLKLVKNENSFNIR